MHTAMCRGCAKCCHDGGGFLSGAEAEMIERKTGQKCITTLSVEAEPGHWVSIESTLGAVIPESLAGYYRPAAVFGTPAEMWEVFNRGRPE